MCFGVVTNRSRNPALGTQALAVDIEKNTGRVGGSFGYVDRLENQFFDIQLQTISLC